MRSRLLYRGPVTGVPDERTVASIRTLQLRLGVTADGVFGPQTRAQAGGVRSPGSGGDCSRSGEGLRRRVASGQLALHGFPSGRLTSAYTPVPLGRAPFPALGGSATDGDGGPLTAALSARRSRSPRSASAGPSPGRSRAATASAEHASTAVWTWTRRSRRLSARPAREGSSGPGWRDGGWGYAVIVAHGAGVRSLSPTSHAWTFESASGYAPASVSASPARPGLVRPSRPPRGAAPRRLRRSAVRASLRSQDTAHRERRMVTRGWRSDEVWLTRRCPRFREQPVRRFRRAWPWSAGVAGFPDDRLAPAATGLDASRRRRLVAPVGAPSARLANADRPCGSAARRRLGVDAPRSPRCETPGAQDINPLLEDPPSLTFRDRRSSVEGVGRAAAPESGRRPPPRHRR